MANSVNSKQKSGLSTSENMTATSPFAIANIRYFIAFRVFFNARFYYPVFTILFLDYGLTIEQFALLNSVWAATIVLAEVPSGALADFLGRRQLLLITSFFMVMEMSLIAFIPLGNSHLVFWAFLINRIFSGLAEAMASGADEALAYDSLIKYGSPGDWPRVLSLMMRIKAAGSILAMSIGALVYDPKFINAVLEFFGRAGNITQQISMRYPVYLTLILGILACITAMRMTEVNDHRPEPDEHGGIIKKFWQLNLMTLQAGKWILLTPFALAIILLGMSFDHTLRMVITLTSQYFRLIGLPESIFGLVGAAMAMLNLFLPQIAEKMVKNYSPVQNMLWMTLITFIALISLTGFFPIIGILPIACVSAGISLTSFFTSHYLNRITPSNLRATILSFKGLAFNLAYGIIGILFALLIAQLRNKNSQATSTLPFDSIADQSFAEAMIWFPWYTGIILLIVFIFSRHILKGRSQHLKKG